MDSVMEVYLAATASTEGDPSLLGIMLHADPIVQLDLLLLVVMSVMCWAITLSKARAFTQAERASNRFLDVFWKSRRLDEVVGQINTFEGSPIAAVFHAGYEELRRLPPGSPEASANVERALRRSSQTQLTALEAYIPFLATTGATAPFIGLFGTVWGILQAFLKLGRPGATATIQVVGPDIAHALVATAVGLVAAIPAVMAYNWFNTRLRVLSSEMEGFSSDFLNLVRRRAS